MTGTAATKARAAAVRSVGSGPAGAVTTDMTGTGFETTVTKSDGTRVEVDLDSSYNTIQGFGAQGGPHPAGGPAPRGLRRLNGSHDEGRHDHPR
ncbi:MAG: hypothetical protein ACTHQQ_14065 [Solirubrobacteraceae bacterium]